jgi:hypothetical protein
LGIQFFYFVLKFLQSLDSLNCFYLKVNLHYLNGFQELAQIVFQRLTELSTSNKPTSFGSPEIPIDHSMKNDPDLIKLLKSRMIQPRDFCVLLALPAGFSLQVKKGFLVFLSFFHYYK